MARRKKKGVDLRNLSLVLIILGSFLFIVSTMTYFTGFSVYDPQITGTVEKTAQWNYTSAGNYIFMAFAEYPFGGEDVTPGTAF